MTRRDLLKALLAAGAVGTAGGLAYLQPWRSSPSGRLHLPESASAHFPFHFADVTKQAGISFLHNSGAFGKKYLPETLGPGCAFLDYDNDGWLDVLLVNGMDWPGHVRQRTTMKLYRNNRDGTFTDVTHEAGLDVELYGIGVAVADYDNDGFQDIFVTTWGQNRLFHNDGKGRFSDVTKASGLDGYSSLSTSALWFDYNRDGHLDLLVANYVKWSPETDIFCTMDGQTKSYCTPEAYPGTTCWLFRNRGNGTFEDVTGKAGLDDPTSKSLGLAMLDYDQDGWPDIFIANDTQPNKLYRNNHDGTFTEKGVLAGVAFSPDGVARAGMGTDAADFNNSGFPGLMVTNFTYQELGLYRNDGDGLFVDVALHSAVGRDTRLTLGFGCFFIDVDLDGMLDLFVANGHIDPTISRIAADVSYAERPELFRNEGIHGFRNVAGQLGKSFASPKVARGAAYGDFDNDGDVDILLTTNSGPAYLYRNDCERAHHHSIRFRTVGKQSNRDGIGAQVRIWTPAGMRWRMVKSGSSYLSSSEQTLTFGLADSTEIDRAVVQWPSGRLQQLPRLPADRTYVVEEEKGVVADYRHKQRLPQERA
jgi:hypothetical protein